jgi:hypothetical protein
LSDEEYYMLAAGVKTIEKRLAYALAYGIALAFGGKE